MKFAIENEAHVTDDVEGLLGFTMAKSYEVKFRFNSGILYTVYASNIT